MELREMTQIIRIKDGDIIDIDKKEIEDLIRACQVQYRISCDVKWQDLIIKLYKGIQE